MTPGTVVEWTDGAVTRRGVILNEEQRGYWKIQASDGTRFVLPEGRLRIVQH